MLKTVTNSVNVSQITGVLPVANGGTGVTTKTGTGNVVLSAAPTLTGVATVGTLLVNGAASTLGTPIEVLGNVAGYAKSGSVTAIGQIGQGYTTATPTGQTFVFSTASSKLFTISTGGGAGVIVFADYKSTLITLLANPSLEFQASATPTLGTTGIFKSANSHAVSVINNTGSTTNYTVLSLGPVTSTVDPV